MQYVSRNGRTVRVNRRWSPARASCWPSASPATAVAAKTNKQLAQRVVNLVLSVDLRMPVSRLDCRTGAAWRQPRRAKKTQPGRKRQCPQATLDDEQGHFGRFCTG